MAVYQSGNMVWVKVKDSSIQAQVWASWESIQQEMHWEVHDKQHKLDTNLNTLRVSCGYESKIFTVCVVFQPAHDIWLRP